jgi:hypothetical protein
VTVAVVGTAVPLSNRLLVPNPVTGLLNVTVKLIGDVPVLAFPLAGATFPFRIQENINAFQVGFNYRFIAPQY